MREETVDFADSADDFHTCTLPRYRISSTDASGLECAGLSATLGLMAGAMQSRYRCDEQIWRNFEAQLLSLKFVVERSGSIPSNDLILDVKTSAQALPLVMVDFVSSPRGAEPGTTEVHTHWFLGKRKTDPVASLEVASEIESLLVGCGAVPLRHSVKEYKEYAATRPRWRLFGLGKRPDDTRKSGE